MPRRPVRRSPVSVTNPAASRLPGALGTARTTPSPPPPIEPVQIPASKQFAETERVRFTNKRAATPNPDNATNRRS